jgi:hypothetical protein
MLVHQFFMDELTFGTVGALTWCCFVPLLAHFGFVIFVLELRTRIKFVVPMGIGTLLTKLALTNFHPVFAEFSFVVNFKVSDVPDHFLTRAKIHLLFGAPVLTRMELHALLH